MTFPSCSRTIAISCGWSTTERAELWASPLPTAPDELVPRRIAELPAFNTPQLGTRYVAYVAPGPWRVLLYDLEGGPTLQWLVPDSIREPRPLYVNDREVAFSVLRSPPAIRFKTVARVQLAAFEPIE